MLPSCSIISSGKRAGRFVILLGRGAASRPPSIQSGRSPAMLQKVKPAVQLKDMSLFRQQCYIDGAWVDADDTSTLAVYNPADGVQIGTVPALGAVETRRAIETAHAAWPGWRAKTAKERAAILRKWFELMMANQEDLA